MADDYLSTRRTFLTTMGGAAALPLVGCLTNLSIPNKPTEANTMNIEIDWNGAGEPIASYFQSRLKVPVYLVGWGDPYCNAHATNESMLVNHGLLLGVHGNCQIMEEIAGGT